MVRRPGAGGGYALPWNRDAGLDGPSRRIVIPAKAKGTVLGDIDRSATSHAGGTPRTPRACQRRFRRLLGLSLTLWALATPPPAAAAFVTLTCIDEEGAPLSDLRLRIEPQTLPAFETPDTRRLRRARSRYGATDLQGQVAFEQLHPGPWIVRVLSNVNQPFPIVPPELNPLAPPVRFTLKEEADVTFPVQQVHRGTPLIVRVHPAGLAQRASLKVDAHETGSSTRRGLVFASSSERREGLFRGRWELTLHPPDGLLLTDLRHGGLPLRGNRLVVDAEPRAAAIVVDAELTAESRIGGKVDFRGELFGVRVEARLVEAGGWLDAAEQRGNPFNSVSSPVDPTGRYELLLPSGTWDVQVVGAGLRSSDPLKPRIALGVGQSVEQNFIVGGVARAKQHAVSMRVIWPGGRGARGAPVEIWPALDEALGEHPIQLGRTDDNGRVSFEGLEPGRYRALSALPGSVESTREFSVSDDPRSGYAPELVLQPGGILTLRALPADGTPSVVDDPDGRSLPRHRFDPIDARVVLRRLDEQPPPLLIQDRFVRESLLRREGRLDGDGRLRLTGIYPGRYELSTQMTTAFLRVAEGSEWVDTVERTWEAAETLDVEAKPFPAGALRGRVACRGGEPIATHIDVRAVPIDHRPDVSWSREWEPFVSLRSDRARLAGDYEEFTAGPLEPDRYMIGLRPHGYDRWTWIYGSEDVSEAASFELRIDEWADAGRIDVDCGPAIALQPVVLSGAAMPPLSRITPRDGNFDVRGQVESWTQGRVEVDGAAVEAYDRRWMIRALPEGPAQLELWVGHETFLPEYWVQTTVEAELERGRTVNARVQIGDIGGVIDVTAPGSPAVLLIAEDGDVQVEPPEDGGVRFTNLPAGGYTVRWCADTGCTATQAERRGILVEPGSVVPVAPRGSSR